MTVFLTPTFSVVSPVYKAEAVIPKLVERIERECEKLGLSFEIILVEDGGPDRSWDVIRQICETNSRVRGIHLSRNFGQHAAITAGLRACRGEWVVVMDCDLQDRPEEISKLYREAMKGYEIVLAIRENRRDGFLKRIGSRLFYRLLSYLTETQQDYRIANFGIYHRKAIDAVLAMKEPFKFFPVMIRWVGFRRTAVEVEHAPREEGRSSYRFRQLFRLALGLATSYSNKPLRLTVKLGLSISVFAFGLGLYYIVQFLRGQIIVLGFASLIVSIWFLSGAIIFVLGIVGLYLGQTFDVTKSRPVYWIKETRNLEE